MPKENPLNSGKAKALDFGNLHCYVNPERIYWGQWKRATTHSTSRTQVDWVCASINTAGWICLVTALTNNDTASIVRRLTCQVVIDSSDVQNVKMYIISLYCKNTIERRILKKGTISQGRVIITGKVASERIGLLRRKKPSVRDVVPRRISSRIIETVTAITTSRKIWKNSVRDATNWNTAVPRIFLLRRWFLKYVVSGLRHTQTVVTKRGDSSIFTRYSLYPWKHGRNMIAYGMGPMKLYNQLNGQGFPITLEQARSLYDKYCKEFKVGVNFLRNSGKKAFKEGYLANLNGRRRNWRRPNDGDAEKFPLGNLDPEYLKIKGAIEREGGNFLIQSVNADITKLAMINIRNIIKKRQFRSNLMLQVYDEIVTCTHENDSEEFHREKVRIMIDSARRWINSVPIEVDGHVLKHWTK